MNPVCYSFIGNGRSLEIMLTCPSRSYVGINIFKNYLGGDFRCATGKKYFEWQVQGVPKTWKFSDEFDIVFVMN